MSTTYEFRVDVANPQLFDIDYRIPSELVPFLKVRTGLVFRSNYPHEVVKAYENAIRCFDPSLVSISKETTIIKSVSL